MNFWELLVTTFVLMLLYKQKSKLKYYGKFTIYILYVALVSCYLLPLFCFEPRNVVNFVKGGKIYKHVQKLIGLKFTLVGAENISKDETSVIVVNHQTSLDIIGMFEIWSVIKKATIIAKRELLYAGPFGIATWLAGIIFIDRARGDRGKAQINEAMEELKIKKTKLWVFPEGTRRNTGVIHEFKKGAFHAAIHAQVPIIPVVFSSYKNFLSAKEKTFDGGEIIIKALPEISTKGLTVDDVDKLIEKTRNIMIKVYNEISN